MLRESCHPGMWDPSRSSIGEEKLLTSWNYRNSSGVHDVFHVSQLKKCLRVPEEQLPLDVLDIQKDLSYKEYLVRILETAERITRSRIIRMCKVQWNRHSVDEATQEREDDLKSDYPNLFESSESRGRDLSQNRPIYKNTSTMAIHKRSHCHT